MYSESYIGIVSIFAGNFAPLGWAFCQGQLLQISEYTALYSVIGTTYGGDGQSTFGLPDLRGRAAISYGQGNGLSNYTLGQPAGTESTTMKSQQLPSHSHDLASITGNPTANSSNGTTDNPTNAVPAVLQNINIYNSSGTGGMQPTTNQVNTGITGSSSPISTLSPYLAMNYVICLEGIFPSQP